MIELNSIDKYQKLCAFMYLILIPLFVLMLEIITGYIDYTRPIDRYSLLIFISPILLLGSWILLTLKIKKLYLPISLKMFFVFLIVGILFRNSSIREIMNILSFIIPYFGLYLLYYKIKNKTHVLILINRLIKFILLMFFIQISLSHLYTLLDFPTAPYHFIWEANASDKPLKTLSYAGHHLSAFIGTYGIIFITYLYYTKIIRIKAVFYVLSLFFLIITILSTARIGLFGILLIFPFSILCYKRLLDPTWILKLIMICSFCLYIAVIMPELMLYILKYANFFQEIVGIQVVNPSYQTLFSGRERLWLSLFDMIQNNPIFGNGHPLPFEIYGLDIRPIHDRRIGHHMFDMQKESGLILAAKYGLPVFISFILFIISPVYKIKNYSLKVMAASISSNAIILLMVNGDFLNSFNNTIIIIMLLFLMHRYSQLEKKYIENANLI